MRILLTSILIAFAGLATAQMTGPQAFEDAKAFGATANSGIKANINSTKGAEVLKDYTSTAPQSSYWQGNATPLSGVLTGGMGTITNCDANIGGMTDPQQRQHCEAVNYMNRLPSVTPPPLVTRTDPLYTTGRAIAADPQAIAGAIQGTYTGCTTNTVTTPAETVDQTCEEYTTTENAKCQIGQVVTVDPDHLYKCLETIKVLSDQTCTVGRVIQVAPEYNYQCIQNQYEVTTQTCDKIAAVSVNLNTELNCTPGQLMGGSGPYGGLVYCDTISTLRYYIPPNSLHPYCANTWNVIVSNPYPGTASYDTGYVRCPGRSFYIRGILSCSGVTCTLRKCLTGSGVPDGCVSTTSPRPYSYQVPAATVVWDNQCTALEARAL